MLWGVLQNNDKAFPLPWRLSSSVKQSTFDLMFPYCSCDNRAGPRSSFLHSLDNAWYPLAAGVTLSLQD